MKLWVLRPIDPDAKDGPWDPWFDKCFGMVVAAEDEISARAIAEENSKAEKTDDNYRPWPVSPWKDGALTSCVELAQAERGLILQEVHWA